MADISRWKDGLSRSFVHAQPFRSVDLIVRGEASGWWHPGAMGPGVGPVSYGAPVHGAEESRLIRRPSVSSQTKRPRLGGNCWSRGQKVSLLLGFAQVECRPSWAPPISMHSLSSAMRPTAISCRAHCLLGAARPIVEVACLARLKQHPSARPATGFLDRDQCAPPGDVDGAKAADDPLD